MEYNKSRLQLVQDKGRYQLVSSHINTFDQYLNIVNTLTQKLHLDNVEYINDYDSYYHSFYFNNVKIIASYNNFLGVNIFVSDESNTDIQKSTLERLQMEVD